MQWHFNQGKDKIIYCNLLTFSLPPFCTMQCVCVCVCACVRACVRVPVCLCLCGLYVYDHAYICNVCVKICAHGSNQLATLVRNIVSEHVFMFSDDT